MHAHDHHGHKHHEPEGADLARAAQSALEKAGEQWTSMRASIFDALASFDKPASAYDIAEAVSKAEGRRVAANSVYRILDLFVSANLARREITLMFEELFRWLPDLRISSEPDRLQSAFINGIKRMRCSFTPTKVPADLDA